MAQRLIADTCQKQVIKPEQLAIHADRGSSMTSKPVAFLLSDLGITKSHSRPYVSNDNPYSESQFKTSSIVRFPGNFGSIEDARAFCQNFFTWYNTEHHHSGIGLLKPEDVHYGRTDQIIKERRRILKVPLKIILNDSKENCLNLQACLWLPGLINLNRKYPLGKYTKLINKVSNFH